MKDHRNETPLQTDDSHRATKTTLDKLSTSRQHLQILAAILLIGIATVAQADDNSAKCTGTNQSLTVAAPASVQPTSGTLAGTVSSGGAPVPGASVKASKCLCGSCITGCGCCPATHHLTTDEQGNFSIKLPPGAYTVWVSAKGFQNYTFETKVSSGKTTSVTIKLKPLKPGQ